MTAGMDRLSVIISEIALLEDEKRAILFWRAVDQSGGPDACWPWTKAIGANGYGTFSVRKKMKIASRFAYELTHGRIAVGPGYHGFVVMHRCDNRRCCNPAHLVLGTHADNMIDRDSKGRTGPRARGEESHFARFKSGEVLDIKRRTDAGESLGAVAKHYQCSKSAVAKIATGASWGWLTEQALPPLGEAALRSSGLSA